MSWHKDLREAGGWIASALFYFIAGLIGFFKALVPILLSIGGAFGPVITKYTSGIEDLYAVVFWLALFVGYAGLWLWGFGKLGRIVEQIEKGEFKIRRRD